MAEMGQRPALLKGQALDWQMVFYKAVHVVGRILLYGILLVGAVVFAMPFIWMFRSSFMPKHLVYNVPIIWIPPRFGLEHYIEPWKSLPFPIFYRNTIFITFMNIIGLVLSSSLVAFGFARIRFWGRDWIFLLLLSTMMLPFQVTMIPIYLFWSRLGAVNTFWPLIVPEWLTNAYNVFLLRQFFMTISPDLDDAARIDGCGWFGIYSRIIVPLSKPALGVIAIQAFAWNWNNFMAPLIYLNEPRNYTIALGLRMFSIGPAGHAVTRYTMADVMAMTIIALIPCLIVFFWAQKRFIQGIVITGVKG